MKVVFYIVLLHMAFPVAAQIKFIDNMYPKVWTDAAFIGTTEGGYSLANRGGSNLGFDVYRLDEDNVKRLGRDVIHRVLNDAISEDVANKILADYPMPPIDDVGLAAYGITSAMTEEAYRKTLDLLFRGYYAGQELPVLSLYGESTNGFNVAAVGGNQVLFVNGGISRSDGNDLYSCDFSQWDFNKNFLLNLNSCVSIKIQRSFIAPQVFRISASEAINNKGISLHRKMDAAGELVLIDPSRGVVELGEMPFEVGVDVSDISITSGNDPFVNISGHLFLYNSGELEKTESFSENERFGVAPLPDFNFKNVGQKLIFSPVDEQVGRFFVCDKYFEGRLSPAEVNKLGCVSDSLVELKGGESILSQSDSGSIYLTTMYLIDAEHNNSLTFNPVLLTYDLSNDAAYSVTYEAYKSLIAQYPNLMAKTYAAAKAGLIGTNLEGFLNEFPNLPQNIGDYGFPEDFTAIEYVSYASSIILNVNPFYLGNSSGLNQRNFFLQVVSERSRVYTFAGYIDFEFVNDEELLTVVVIPESEIIDPYVNPVSSIDIVTRGEVFAVDITCSIEGPLGITQASYGLWGGDQRFTFPIEWENQTVHGVASLKGNIPPIFGEQNLLYLDTFAELTTDSVSVGCVAVASDQNGNLLPVQTIPARIRIDDGIHGGSGTVTGQVQLPAGLEYIDVFVEITIDGRTIRVPVDEQGKFWFEGLRDGSFVLNVLSERHTQSCINVTTLGVVVDVGYVELVAGDINNDGEINIADYTLVAAHYGSVKGESNFNPLADLNADDVINIQDLAILSGHFGSRQCNF